MPRRVTNRIPTCIVKVCPMSCFRIRAAALGCRPMGGQVRGIMRACCSTSPGRISLAARSASSPAASRLVWLMRNDSTIDAIYSSAQRIARWWPVTHWSQAARVGPLVVMQTRIAAVRLAITGLLLIGLMAFRPQGMFGKKEEMVLGE